MLSEQKHGALFLNPSQLAHSPDPHWWSPGQKHPLAPAHPPPVTPCVVWLLQIHPTPAVTVIFSFSGLNPSALVHCSQTKLSAFRLQQPTCCDLSLPVPSCPALTWPWPTLYSAFACLSQLLQNVLASDPEPPLPWELLSSLFSLVAWTAFLISAPSAIPQEAFSRHQDFPLTSPGHTG